MPCIICLLSNYISGSSFFVSCAVAGGILAQVCVKGSLANFGGDVRSAKLGGRGRI